MTPDSFWGGILAALTAHLICAVLAMFVFLVTYVAHRIKERRLEREEYKRYVSSRLKEIAASPYPNDKPCSEKHGMHCACDPIIIHSQDGTTTVVHRGNDVFDRLRKEYGA